MKPSMTSAEVDLFTSFATKAINYLEFGSGGSTYVATQLVQNSVTAVDSSSEWLERVRQACLLNDCRLKPVLVAVDIGPTGDWGAPADYSTRDRWPSYYETVWDRADCSDCDLYLVDGRFRIACFMKILLNCRPDALIIIHDFASRPNYHIVRDVAREIAIAEELSVFIPKLGQSRKQIREILHQHRLNAG
jgi:hypothetical protein